MSSPSNCSHRSVHVDSSPNAEVVGYKTFTPQQLFTAATGSQKRLELKSTVFDSPDTFPAPLVLPGDELAGDPKYPPQSFRSWLNEEARNVVTEKRQTVYIAAPPRIGASIEAAMIGWIEPRSEIVEDKDLVAKPAFPHILAYLQAFFHDLPVRHLPLSHDLEFTNWEGATRLRFNSQGVAYIGVQSAEVDVVTRIRVRKVKGRMPRSPYTHQLNLNDLLDHAISILPSHAYCLVMLLDHDLYEDEEDDFCCGRAYGGSRVAVVSTAQYQPQLDTWHAISLREGHWWPGSHCGDFITEHCPQKQMARPAKRRKITAAPKDQKHFSDELMSEESTNTPGTDLHVQGNILKRPMEAAFSHHVNNLSNLHHLEFSPHDLQSIYLRRVTLTVAHELLHCFGLDHCVYRACAMQGSSSVLEDSRQPPFLCMICENKLARAIVDRKTSSLFPPPLRAKGSSNENWWESPEITAYKRARQEQILKFCERQGPSDPAFGPLAAWTRGHLGFFGTIESHGE